MPDYPRMQQKNDLYISSFGNISKSAYKDALDPSGYFTKIVSKHLPAFMDGILILVGFKNYGQLSNCQEMRKSVEFCHPFSTSTTMNMNRILSQCTCVSKTTNLSYLANTVSTRWVSNQNSLKQHIIHSKNEILWRGLQLFTISANSDNANHYPGS